MIRAGVIGWPISHSRSPVIHGYWLKQLSIEGSYERLPVEPGRLEDFMRELAANGYAGCNVTIPHKESVFRLTRPADESTLRLGAVNTVYIRNGQVLGTNTDGEGFNNSILSSQPGYTFRNKRAVVLGAGGAAMAVTNALLLNGISEIAIANRSIEKTQQLRLRFGQAIRPVEWIKRSQQLPECDFLVNTTSLGMKGQPELEIDLQHLPTTSLVCDIVYVPLRTKLLEQALARGNQVVEGLGMLLHQAVRGFELWFGARPMVTNELYDLIARDIDPAYHR